MTSKPVENAKIRVELEVCHNCIEDVDPETCGTATFNSPSEGESVEIYYCDRCATQNFANLIDSLAASTDDDSTEGLQKILHDQLDEYEGYAPD